MVDNESSLDPLIFNRGTISKHPLIKRNKSESITIHNRSFQNTAGTLSERLVVLLKLQDVPNSCRFQAVPYHWGEALKINLSIVAAIRVHEFSCALDFEPMSLGGPYDPTKD
jgi:hypothetical protein